MGIPLVYPTDTQDLIEQKWSTEVGKSFPAYGAFWSEFIGHRAVGGRLHPYGLVLPKPPTTIRTAVVVEAYDRLSLTHYSLFCELAGAHVNLSELGGSYALGNPEERLFAFLEAFNGFYDHLGTARNMVHGLWFEFARMQAAIAGFPDLLESRRFPAQNFIRHYLAQQKRTSTIDDLNKVEGVIVPIRNHHVHDHVGFFVEIRGRFHVQKSPLELKVKPQPPFGYPHEDVYDRMERHLQLAEMYCEGVDSALQVELRGLLSRSGINVDY